MCSYFELLLSRDCRLMFSIWAKQRSISSISASDSSKFQFNICFRSFRPDFLSVFYGEDTVPPQKLRINCKFQCQAAAKRALCSILSVCNNFVNCPVGFCLLPTNSFFQMKNLNKLADVMSLFVIVISWKIGDYCVESPNRPMPTLMKK